MSRTEYLERLILGLEQSIENTRALLPYYEPGDLEGFYAKKFLASMEENLAKARKELGELKASQATSAELEKARERHQAPNPSSNHS